MVDDPVPALYVVRDEYQPGIVELSVQTLFVPVAARVSKFSERGVPKAKIDPLLVIANAGLLNGKSCNNNRNERVIFITYNI